MRDGEAALAAVAFAFGADGCDPTRSMVKRPLIRGDQM
jgi:hypothetical protein